MARTGQSQVARVVAVALICLALVACASPTTVDQGQDRSPLLPSAPPAVAGGTEETAVPSPLATGTSGPQPEAPSPTAAQSSQEEATVVTSPETQEIMPAVTTLEPQSVITAPAEPPLPTPLDPAGQALVQQAIEDLAGRLGLDGAQIELVAFELVIWPDKGFGCPKPGLEYPQVPQDGVYIQLRAAKRLYDYHWGGSGPPFLCEQ